MIFDENSEVEIIKENAFYSSSIEQITIPKKVKIIERKLFIIALISQESIYQMTVNSTISMRIHLHCQASHGSSSFHGFDKLMQIQFSSNSELHLICRRAFSFVKSIKSISLPFALMITHSLGVKK